MRTKACLIANPAAGRGRGARSLRAARSAFADLVRGDVRQTMGPGDEARLVRSALADGCTTIAVLGGDGTWSKTAAALVAMRSECRLVPLAAGTGNDFAKSMGLPADDFVAMAALAAAGVARAIDVGEIEGRPFLNSVGFGFDVAALEVAAATPWLRGDALYPYAALNLLFRYRGVHTEVLAPGDVPDPSPRLRLGLVVANAPRFGGSFMIAPGALPDDGLLDVVSIADAPAGRRVSILRAVSRGTHTGGAFPEVHAASATEVSLRFAQPPRYEADGELLRARATELTVRCRPGALRVVATAPDVSRVPGASLRPTAR